jgi:peptide chain release factor subunit 1
MPDVLDQDRIAQLIAMPRGEEPYVSLYLKGWGPLADRRATLKNLVREGEAQIEADTGWSDARKKAARSLLDRLRVEAEQLVGRMPAQGRGAFALFCGEASPKAEVIPLPLDLRDRVVVDRSPYASPLSSLIDQFERYGVVIADSRHGKIFEVYLGVVEGWEEFESDIPAVGERVANTPGPNAGTTKTRSTSGRSGSPRGGFHGLDELRRQHHADFVIHQHLQAVADRAFRRFRLRPFDRLIIGGPANIIPQLEEHLHSYLRQRVVAREELQPVVALSPEEARKRILAVEARVEEEKERELLRTVKNHLGGSGLATAGLDDTLRALFFGQVRTLIVREGESLPGRECPECHFLFTRPQDELERTPTLVECPVCKRATRRVPDILDEAIELAISSGARVEHVAYARDEIANLGGVAAVLRFK